MKFIPFLSIAGFLALSAIPSHANSDFSVASGTQQVSLVELYTSEGCSSCPPAERYLNGLKDQPGLWTKFVPVAFHITYWDKLGWKDHAGDESYDVRQRDLASQWGSSSIYTPCFVRNGAEWHPEGDAPTAGKTDIGILRLTRHEGNKIEVVFAPTAKNKEKYVVQVGLLGSGILTKVQRGENAGRDLAHEFTLLHLQQSDLNLDADGKYTASLDLAAAQAKAPKLALVAWVETPGHLEPIQATGGWLP